MAINVLSPGQGRAVEWIQIIFLAVFNLYSLGGEFRVQGTPHPVTVTIMDNQEYISVVLYSYYATITGRGVLPMCNCMTVMLYIAFPTAPKAPVLRGVVRGGDTGSTGSMRPAGTKLMAQKLWSVYLVGRPSR